MWDHHVRVADRNTTLLRDPSSRRAELGDQEKHFTGRKLVESGLSRSQGSAVQHVESEFKEAFLSLKSARRSLVQNICYLTGSLGVAPLICLT